MGYRHLQPPPARAATPAAPTSRWPRRVETVTEGLQRLEGGVPLSVSPPAPLSNYLHIYEVAKEIGVSAMTVRRWMDQGLPYHRSGGNGHPRIARSALTKWMAAKQRP
jgi:excisionase family DNA binding protein